MSETELQELRRLLGWIYNRTSAGCCSRKRSERDAALSDVCHFTQPFQHCWDGTSGPRDPNHLWFGEQP